MEDTYILCFLGRVEITRCTSFFDIFASSWQPSIYDSFIVFLIFIYFFVVVVENVGFENNPHRKKIVKFSNYNAFNVYRRELAPGTVSLTRDRAQGEDSKHWAYSSKELILCILVTPKYVLWL